MSEERANNPFTAEPARETPVRYTADVVVAGGGIAGCAAALAAARNGADVLLIEKQTMLGGLATAGLITYYLPLCDGEGRQMCYGIAEELLHLSVKHHPEKDIPDCWRKTATGAGGPGIAGGYGTLDPALADERRKYRYETRFSPGYMALLLEEKLREAGVRILYDTRICSVIKSDIEMDATINAGAGVTDSTHIDGLLIENESGRSTGRTRIQGLIIENESGRSAVTAGAFIDATGSAALFKFAGAPVRDHGQGNILANWYYYLKDGKHILKEMGAAPSIMAEEFDAGEPASDRAWYAGTDGDSVSDFISATHEKILADLRAGDREVTILPTMPQFRMTRCMIGAYELKETENDVHFEDSIGMTGDWRKRGMRYEIPYRCLYSDRADNLWAAGRCISVDDGMWDISRVIPPAAVTGEAAGTAAALVVKDGNATVPATEGGAAVNGKSDSLTAAALPYGLLARALRAGGQKLTLDETE